MVNHRESREWKYLETLLEQNVEQDGFMRKSSTTTNRFCFTHFIGLEKQVNVI